MKIMRCQTHGEKEGKFCDECGEKLVKSQSDKVKKVKNHTRCPANHHAPDVDMSLITNIKNIVPAADIN